MAKDKDLNEVSADFPIYGKDHLSLTIERQRTFPIPKSDEVSVVHGNVKSSLITQSARGSRGQMNQVRDYLSAEALAAFNK